MEETTDDIGMDAPEEILPLLDGITLEEYAEQDAAVTTSCDYTSMIQIGNNSLWTKPGMDSCWMKKTKWLWYSR